LALGGIAVAACVAVTAISFFAARALTHHRSSRPSVTPADSGLTYQVVPLKAKDGTVLEGWWIIPKDGQRRRDLATVILVHGADGEAPEVQTGKAGMLRDAAPLSRAGFIVLSIDLRSYGGSEGSGTGGEVEEDDLEAATMLVRARSIDAPVVLVGRGIGGYLVAVSTTHDTSIDAAVAIDPVKPGSIEAFTSDPRPYERLLRRPIEAFVQPATRGGRSENALDGVSDAQLFCSPRTVKLAGNMVSSQDLAVIITRALTADKTR